MSDPTGGPPADVCTTSDGTSDPAARRTCDLPTWQALLTGADLDRATVSWLVKQASGWPDYGFATRADLYADLLASPVPLTAADLVTLTGSQAGEGPPSAELARQLLAHRACDLTVVCELARACTSGYGGVRTDDWQSELPRQLLRLLVEHPDPRVRVTAIVYAAGLAPWCPTETGLGDFASAHGRAHRALVGHLAAVDVAGAWADLEQLLEGGTAASPDLLAAVVAAAAPAPSSDPGAGVR